MAGNINSNADMQPVRLRTSLTKATFLPRVGLGVFRAPSGEATRTAVRTALDLG